MGNSVSESFNDSPLKGDDEDDDALTTPLYEWTPQDFYNFLMAHKLEKNIIQRFNLKNNKVSLITSRYKTFGEALYHISSPNVLATITKDTKSAKIIFDLLSDLKRKQIKKGVIQLEKKTEMEQEHLRLMDEIFEKNAPQNYHIFDFSDDECLVKDIIDDQEAQSTSSSDQTISPNSVSFLSSNSSIAYTDISLGSSVESEKRGGMFTSQQPRIESRYTSESPKIDISPKVRLSHIYHPVKLFPNGALTDAEKIAVKNCCKKLESTLKNQSVNQLQTTAQNLCLPDRFKYRFFHPNFKQGEHMIQGNCSKKKVSLPLKLVITTLSDTQMHRVVRRLGHLSNIANQDEKGGFGLFHTAIIVGNWYVEFNDNSIACVRPISSSKAVFVCNIKYYQESEINEVINKVSRVCCFWNATQYYDVKSANCQHFTQAVLQALNIDIKTCPEISPLVKQYFFKLKKYGLCSMTYTLPQEIRPSFPFSEITFKTHQELDQFWLTVCSKHVKWVSTTDEGMAHEDLLKSFDRAFWLRRLSSKEGCNEVNEPLREDTCAENCNTRRCLCPFNVYEMDTHTFFLAESVMGQNFLGTWVPEVPYRAIRVRYENNVKFGKLSDNSVSKKVDLLSIVQQLATTSMAYQSINARKEEFRKYLEKNGVVDSFTKSLVALYEEPERPPNPLDYIKHYLGGPSAEDIEQLKQENEKLKQRLKDLEEQRNQSEDKKDDDKKDDVQK